MHPKDMARVNEMFAQVLASTQTAYEVEFRLRHRDDHYVPVRDARCARRTDTRFR